MSGVESVLTSHLKWVVWEGDCMSGLLMLPDNSIDCIVTSPPYYGLRHYGTDPQLWDELPGCQHVWGAPVRAGHPGQKAQSKWKKADSVAKAGNRARGQLCGKCGAWMGELGAEPTCALYLDHLTQVMGECLRVLKPKGTMWLNIGDSYGGSGMGPTGKGGIGNQERRQGFSSADRPPLTTDPDTKNKSLYLVPERLAIRLNDQGWYIRSRIAWCKKSCLPESVKDRPTNAWEHVWLCTKSAKYYYDQDAVREPSTSDMLDRASRGHTRGPGGKLDATRQDGSSLRGVDGMVITGGGHQQRSYWLLGPEPYPGAHFAVMPTELARRCILAGCPPGGVVLDPFSGSGTTVMTALRLGMRGIGLELNPGYAALSRDRITQDDPLFNLLEDPLAHTN